MSADSVLVIINPLAGGGGRDVAARGRRRAAAARAALDAAGVTGRVEVTTHAGHAHELAVEAGASGVSRVVVWGGDGTVNEVGRALAFGPVALAIVPGGSGNGLARTLGISTSAPRALQQALAGTARRIDAGEIAGHLFFNLAGLGFDAHVARIFNDGGHRRGFARYLGTSLVELFRYRSERYGIASGSGERVERRALMVVVANGSQYGNGARVAPDARLDDGLLDLVVIESHSPWRDLLRARYLFDGSIAGRPGVSLTRVEHASIENGAGPVSFHADGESLEHTGAFAVRVHAGALLVVPG